jgi:hypothetical protein
MTTARALAFPGDDLVGWERALYAFLVEKERRSGSTRTVEGYSRMLCDFFAGPQCSQQSSGHLGNRVAGRGPTFQPLSARSRLR